MSAQLFSNLIIQPTLQATQPILQDLNFPFDVQHEHPLQLDLILAISAIPRLLAQPPQHSHCLASIPFRQSQYRLVILPASQDIIYSNAQPLHLWHIDCIFMWQRVRTVTIYLQDVHAVGIGIEETKHGGPAAGAPDRMVIKGSEETAGREIWIAFCLGAK